MKGSAALRQEADSSDCWNGFRPGDWTTSINVRDFIVRNVTPYKGNEDFLAEPSQRTKAVWGETAAVFRGRKKEGGACGRCSGSLDAHKAGYIDRENEVIVGLQTDQPFKRAIFPYGGLRMVKAGL
jgi:formate C-acetyltransferase